MGRRRDDEWMMKKKKTKKKKKKNQRDQVFAISACLFQTSLLGLNRD